MDDFDIYSDLPDFAWLKEAYEEDVEIKEDELPISAKEVKELKEKLLKLEKVHKMVLSHYSSLWKTSKQERKRMDRQIADLRRQLDNFAFKRNHWTNVPPPVPIKPPIALPTNLLPSNESLFKYPPPLMGITVPPNPLVNPILCNYPPPPINPTVCKKQELKKEEDFDEQFVDNYAVPSNVITPENSHSSDESEDDIVKKSEYKSTVYGERLRKKLLEEKRNAMKLKLEPKLDENKGGHEIPKQKQIESGNINQLNHRNNKEVTNIKNETNTRTVVKEFSRQEQNLIGERKIKQQDQIPKKLEDLNEEKKRKENKATSVNKETDTRTVKEKSNNEQNNEIETKNVRVEPMKKDKDLGSKGNKELIEQSIMKEADNDSKKKEDLKKNQRDNVDEKKRDNEIVSGRDRDFNKRTEDEESKLRRERDLERTKRENAPRTRRERELDRRRKEEEIEKTKREEQLVKRRDEEKIEKTNREERLVKRRDEEEIERRRKDQEIDKRKKEEIDVRRRSKIERKRKDQEIERRRREELNSRRKVEEERRKERELKIIQEKENERRRKEEELHEMKLKDIEKKRNEKQLEELINERKRIENEMNALNSDKSEEEENSRSIKNLPCKEDNGKSQDHKEQSKLVFKDNSKQSSKNQDATAKDDKNKADQHSCGNKNSSSADINRSNLHDKRRDDVREYSSSKSNQYQNNHSGYEKCKYNERRSKRDQLDREHEPRKNLHRNKSRHRHDSSYRNNEERRSCSPKRIKVERDGDDKLKNPFYNKNDKNRARSPKRRRLSKSEERSPQKIKRRKISQDKDQDCNIKSDANSIHKTNFISSVKVEESTLLSSRKISDNSTKNIVNTTTSDKNISTSVDGNKSKLLDKAANVNGYEKIQKVDGDKVPTHSTDSQKTTRALSTIDQQIEDQNKLKKNRTDKQITSQANKKKTLIDELFETGEESVDASAALKNVEKVDKTLNETVLSELEDGEIDESDDSMGSENLPKLKSHNPPMKKPIKVPSSNKNVKNKNVASLQKNDRETALKCPSELKNSILHELLTQRDNDTIISKTKIRSEEKVSNKNISDDVENCKRTEICNLIVNRPDNKSSQITDEKQISVNETKNIRSDEKVNNKTESDNVEICEPTETLNKIVNRPVDQSSQITDEKQIAVNKTKTIECSENNEATDSKVVNSRVVPEVEETKTIATSSDNVITIMKEEKEIMREKTNENVTVEKTHSEKSEKCRISSLINAPPDVSSKQPDQNCLRNNNSESKHDKQRIQNLKKTDICSETNNIKNTCLKENVNVNNDCSKKTSGKTTNTKVLNKELLKLITKSEIPDKNDAINNSLLTPSKAPIRNIIIVKRRRKPVQLSDSPPVVVVNNNTVYKLD